MLRSASNIVWPQFFTVMIWVYHRPCPIQGGSHQIILHKPGHFTWEFDESINGYSVSIMNSSTSITLQGIKQPIVYHKWLHLTLVNGADGLKMILYSDQILMESLFIDIAGQSPNYVYVSQNSNPPYQGFNGNLFKLFVFDSALSSSKISQIYNTYNRDQLFFNNVGNIFFSCNIAFSQDLYQPNYGMYDKRFTSYLVKEPETTSYYSSFFYGGYVNFKPTFSFFNGNSWILYTKIDSNTVKYLSFSFWFRPMYNILHIEKQSLVFIPNLLKLQFNTNYSLSNNIFAADYISLSFNPVKALLKIPIQRAFGIWNMVKVDIEPTKIILVVGSSQTSINFEKIPELSISYLQLGRDVDKNGFTGMMREFSLYRDNTNNTQAVWNNISAKRNQQTKYSNKVFNNNLMNGMVNAHMFLLFPNSQIISTPFSLEWKKDASNLILCPSYTSFEFDFVNNSLCCHESYVLMMGKSQDEATLTLPLPMTSWGLDGSICLKLYVHSSNFLIGKTFLLYGNFNVSWQYFPNIHAAHFVLYNGDSYLWSKTLNFPGNTWVSLCFGFEQQLPSTDHIVFISSSYDHKRYNSTALPHLTFTASGRLILFSNHTEFPIFVKQLLILNRAISNTEHYIYHSMHPELIPDLGSSVIAWWPLNETGDFHDPINGMISQRLNTSLSGGMSVLVSTYLFSSSSESNAFFLEETNSYYPLQVKNDEVVAWPIIQLAIDFSDLVESRWVKPRFPSQSEIELRLGGQPFLPESGFASRYHGLVIQNSDYEFYIATISKAIHTGWISIWFNKQDPTEKTLISGYGGAGKGSQFSISIGTSVKLTGPTGTSVSDSSSLSSNSWHNLFVLWNVSNDLEMGYILDNGYPQFLSVPATGFSENSDAKIVLGIQMDASGTPVTSSIFEGYIRRIELIDYEAYTPLNLTEILTVMSSIVKKFIAISGCDTTYDSCPFCDLFSMQCFTEIGYDRLPDNSAACPSECVLQNHTSCDSATTCSGCNKFACLSCYKGLCTRCINNFFPDDEGNCVCPEKTFLNITNLMCESCHSSCNSCIAPHDATQCQTCKELYTWFQVNSSTKICVTVCPENYYSKNGECVLKCHFTCATCSEALDSTKCLSCNPLFPYMVDTAPGICVRNCPPNSILVGVNHCDYCHPSCARCQLAANSSACYSCSNSSHYLNPLFKGSSIGTCSDACPSIDTFKDTINMKCQKCPVSTYQNSQTKECLKCHDTCFGCTEPENAYRCLGCSSQYPYLRLESKKAASGKCDRKCGLGEEKMSRFICVPSTTEIISETLVENVSLGTSGALIAAVLIGISISIILSGSFDSLVVNIGSLQTLLFISFIQVPNMPSSLTIFYKQMGFAFFEFLPNVVLLFVENNESRFSHPALPSDIFLVNIGNVIFLWIIIGLLLVIAYGTSHSWSISDKLNKNRIKIVNEILLFSFCEIWLSSVVQIVNCSLTNSTLTIMSHILAFLAGFGCLAYCGFVSLKLHQTKRNSESPNSHNGYSCFYEHYNQTGPSFFSILNFLIHRVFGAVVVICFHYPTVQIVIVLIINIYQLLFDIILRPYKSRLHLAMQIICSIAVIASDIIYFFLNNKDLLQNSLELLGFSIMLILLSATLLSCFLSVVYSGISIYQSLCARKPEITPQTPEHSISKLNID